MSNNIDFKKLWLKQEAIIPDTKELFRKANKYRRNNLYKLIFATIALLLVIVFMIGIWFNYQAKFISTKIGIIVTITAFLVLAVYFTSMFSVLSKKDLEIKEHLKRLIKLKEKQLFLHSTIMRTYIVLLSVGLSLYIYEHTTKMSLFWAIFTYAATLIWIAISWFYLGSKTIKKEQNKINRLIDKFKELREQLTV
jgi:amino acid transporter